MRETLLPAAPWNPEWDQCLLEASLESHHTHFDPLAAMLVRRIGDDFNDHSALRHACASILRRNVTMDYTNIAVQGTFVLLAASTASPPWPTPSTAPPSPFAA